MGSASAAGQQHGLGLTGKRRQAKYAQRFVCMCKFQHSPPLSDRLGQWQRATGPAPSACMYTWESGGRDGLATPGLPACLSLLGVGEH